MTLFLTEDQKARYAQFQEYAEAWIRPFAAAWDEAQQIPETILEQLGKLGYLGGLIPSEYGGGGWDAVTFGLLNEALGRMDSAVTSVVTVQSMVAGAILKWGSTEQRNRWLPLMAAGDILAAFALTEPGAGSDLRSIAAAFQRNKTNNGLTLEGEKKWITFGQRADVFLVFGMLEEKPLACLVPRASDGLEVLPIHDMVGFRASGLARLHFRQVHIPPENVIGKAGFGLSHVASIGLHYGRISTACSGLGLLRACLEESTDYALLRKVDGRKLSELGLVQALLAKVGTEYEAAQLLCWSACRAEDAKLPEAYTKASIAKHYTSRAAVEAAGIALQILGASGCHESSPVARYYRGAKIFEIIEGTSQIHQLIQVEELMREAHRRRHRRQRDPLAEGLLEASPARLARSSQV